MQYCTKYMYGYYILGITCMANTGGGAENSWWGASGRERKAEGGGEFKIIIVVVPWVGSGRVGGDYGPWTKDPL